MSEKVVWEGGRNKSGSFYLMSYPDGSKRPDPDKAFKGETVGYSFKCDTKPLESPWKYLEGVKFYDL